MMHAPPKSPPLPSLSSLPAGGWFQLSAIIPLFLFLFAFSAKADLSAENTFVWKQANATTESARTKEDFLSAARQYNHLLNSGVRNGPLFYNMGTALLLAGDYDNAVAAFTRAERYMGSNWEIKRNLRIALAHNEEIETTPLPWHRLLLFWHYNLPASTRITITSCALSIICVLITLRILGFKKLVTPPLVITSVVLIIFGSSAFTTIHQESTAKVIRIEIPTE
ncbi:MAG: hypothetical protein KAH23_05740 [Kiritimatiellae bacterium]|nr:hypothetical protein [Kiritimatiellia bacterium]